MLRGFHVFVSGMALAAVALTPAIARAQDPAAAAPAPLVLPLDGGEVALITILIKPDKAPDFEMVLSKLKDALNRSEKPERKQQAASWSVFKAAQPVNGSTVYIMRIDPVVKGQEYDISRLIAEVFPVEVTEIYNKYKDAFVGRAIMYLNPHLKMSQ